MHHNTRCCLISIARVYFHVIMKNRIYPNLVTLLSQAAIYGALCGHVARVLPVCRGWEDTAWAFVRCWLEVAADDALGTS